MTTQDPFEAGQREALRSTDELLDRIGARAPTPEDLDDPVVAALALMAAEIDLDAIPVEITRAALEQALPELQVGLHRASGVAAGEPRRVLDLRDDSAPQVLGVLGSHPPLVATAAGWSRDVDSLRGPRRPGRRPEHAAVAMAPPRSLPRVAARPGHPGWPEGRAPRRLRPLTAVAAVVAAIILGSGVTAAVTGGRSVNPLFGLQQVMAELTNGRTIDQQALYEADVQRIGAARSYAQQGNRSEAIRQLNRVATADLSLEDRDHILAQVKQVLGLLGEG